MAAKENALPLTSYMVLGLLSFGQAMSGYEIRKWAENMRFFYWSPAQSQIYSELKRLAHKGFVSMAEVAQEGKPDKRLYQITPAGSAEMARWQAQAAPADTMIKNPTALRLYFGHAATLENLIALLTAFISETEEKLAQCAIVQEHFSADEEMFYPALVVDWSYYQLEAELAAAQKVLARLEAELQSSAE